MYITGIAAVVGGGGVTQTTARVVLFLHTTDALFADC